MYDKYSLMIWNYIKPRQRYSVGQSYPERQSKREKEGKNKRKKKKKKKMKVKDKEEIDI